MPAGTSHCPLGRQSVTSLSLPFTRISPMPVIQWFCQNHVDFNSVTIVLGEVLMSPNFIKIVSHPGRCSFFPSFLLSWFCMFCFFFPDVPMLLWVYLQPEFRSPSMCSLGTLTLFLYLRLFLSPRFHLPLSPEIKTCRFS